MALCSLFKFTNVVIFYSAVKIVSTVSRSYTIRVLYCQLECHLLLAHCSHALQRNPAPSPGTAILGLSALLGLWIAPLSVQFHSFLVFLCFQDYS